MSKEKMIKFTDLDLSNCLAITKEKVSKEELEKIETSKIKIDENEVFRLMQIADGSHADDWKGTKEKTKETKEKTKETKEKTKGTKEKTEGTIRLINKVQEKIKIEDAEYRKSANMDFPYIAASIVTKAELTLYHFMDANLCNRDNIVILTKVRLGDLINLDTRLTNDKSYYWKVACKHVDYVICRKDNMKVLCVVELDDYTHETKEAQEKDMFIMQALKTAGIDTVRIKTRIASISKADLEMIDEYINKEFAPKCPACGLPMVPKKCMRGYRKGHRFYACLNNVSCRYTINID